MSTAYGRPLVAELRHEADALRGNWLWFVLLGVALIVLGVIALGSVWIAGLATALAIGALLVVSGVAEVVGAIWSWAGAASSTTCSPACCRSWSGCCSCGRRSMPCSP